jgi:spore coat polysaccharide biosynthesis predicted glycosyltransferase SpsG
MRILIVCKASTDIGFGHLVRARTFAEKLMQVHFDVTLDFVIIGNSTLRKLLSGLHCQVHLFDHEQMLSSLDANYHVVFFDTITISQETVLGLKDKSSMMVSLSPVFDQMRHMDLMFTRTKYAADNQEQGAAKTYRGLEFTLVQPDCYKIDTNFYMHSLSKSNFHLAISMGGGDAANKSLEVVKTLKELPLPATIWVMLGEGYKHSYDRFIEVVEKDSEHEIILAKTNKSMWSVLNNCSLLITTSGITSYEAVYAGLPTITYFDSASQFYLLKELVERGVTINGGLFNSESLSRLNHSIAEVYHNRGRLVEMHRKSLNLIDNSAAFKIFETVSEELRTKAQDVSNSRT